MNNEVHSFGDVSPSWLANELDEHGVVRLADVFSAEWLHDMRASVADYIAVNGNNDFYIDHADREIGSPAHRLVSDPAVRRLVAETAGIRRPDADPTGDAMRVSMLVRGGHARKSPTRRFHYDPCILTMVVPIVIPQATFGTCGELIALANTRPFRRFHATHLLDTLMTHNALYRRYTLHKVYEHPEKYVVDLHPGDAYLFWGYRTFHGNLDCAPGPRRTTLVLKFGNVHPASSWISKLAWRVSRSRRDLRRLQYLPARPASPETHLTKSKPEVAEAS